MNAELLSRLNVRARRVVALAEDEARALNHRYIDTEHLLLGLVGEGEGIGIKALESAGIDPGIVQERLLAKVRSGRSVFPAPLDFSTRARKALDLSRREATFLGHDRVGTEHLLLGLMGQRDGLAAEVLTGLGADLRTLREQVTRLRHGYQGQRLPWPTGPFGSFLADPAPPPPAVIPASRVLDQHGRNLTQMARQGELSLVPGLTSQTSWLREVLTQTDGGNPVLVTAPGSGLAVAEGLALDCARPDAPETVRQTVLYYVDLLALVSPDGDGSGPDPGSVEVIDAIWAETRSRPEITLFIDRLPGAMNAAARYPSLTERLTALLVSGLPRIITTVPLADYRRCLDEGSHVLCGLQPVLVAEPMVAYTADLLKLALRQAMGTRILAGR